MSKFTYSYPCCTLYTTPPVLTALRSLPDGSAWVLDSYPVTVEQAKVATVFGADLLVQRAMNMASTRTQFAVQNRVMVVLSTHM